jgi:RNA polymerase sigma factor (sigma-70 family)
MDISKYYESISKYKDISREDEEDMFLLLDDKGLPESEKQKIREALINSNLRFVFRQAKAYSKGDIHLFEELIAAGNEGLIVGLKKYKPSAGTRLLSYAGFWISQRILKTMGNQRIVSLPIYKQQIGSRIQKYLQANENCTFEDLKKAFPEISDKDLKDLSENRYLTYYLEDIGDDPALEIDPIGTDVEVRMDRERIHSAISALPYPHSEIIFRLFGIKDGIERTRADLAKELGLTKDSLREYRREALDMLKDKLADHLPHFIPDEDEDED